MDFLRVVRTLVQSVHYTRGTFRPWSISCLYLSSCSSAEAEKRTEKEQGCRVITIYSLFPLLQCVKWNSMVTTLLPIYIANDGRGFMQDLMRT